MLAREKERERERERDDGGCTPDSLLGDGTMAFVFQRISKTATHTTDTNSSRYESERKASWHFMAVLDPDPSYMRPSPAI